MLEKYKKLSVVAKASLWAFFANIIQKGLTILVIPIFTRILTPNEFAQYTLYQSWHDIFIIFISLNVFNYAIYSGMKEFKDDQDGFIATTQSLITGLCVLCFIVYCIVQFFFGDIINFPLYIICIMFLDILFLSVFNIWTAKERYIFQYRLMTFLSILIGLAGPLLGLFAIFCVSREYGRIYGVAITNVIIGLGIYIYNYHKSKNKFDKRYIKFIFAYCIPLIPHFLATNVLTKFDRIMIGDMCNVAKAGIYGLAYSLSSLMLIVNDAILKSLVPWTYQTIKEGKNLNKLKKNVNYLVLLVAAVNIILILFAPEAIKIFATSDYYEAIYIIPPVSASVYYMFLFNLYANIEYYYSETKHVASASILAAITNVVLNYIFIKKFGYLAAGYTTLVSYILYSFGHYVLMKKVCKKHANSYDYYDNKKIFVISLIFTIISILIIPIYQNMWLRYSFIFLILVLLLLNYKKIMSLIFKDKNKNRD